MSWRVPWYARDSRNLPARIPIQRADTPKAAVDWGAPRTRTKYSEDQFVTPSSEPTYRMMASERRMRSGSRARRRPPDARASGDRVGGGFLLRVVGEGEEQEKDCHEEKQAAAGRVDDLPRAVEAQDQSYRQGTEDRAKAEPRVEEVHQPAFPARLETDRLVVGDDLHDAHVHAHGEVEQDVEAGRRPAGEQAQADGAQARDRRRAGAAAAPSRRRNPETKVERKKLTALAASTRPM